jgi:hypothetical protein
LDRRLTGRHTQQAPMIEVVWSKPWHRCRGGQLLLVGDQRVSIRRHMRRPHARGTFGAQQGGLKYLANLVLPRGPWIRTNVG